MGIEEDAQLKVTLIRGKGRPDIPYGMMPSKITCLSQSVQPHLDVIDFLVFRYCQ